MAGYFPNYYGTPNPYPMMQNNPVPMQGMGTQNPINTMMNGYQNINSMSPMITPPTNPPVVPQLTGKIVDGEDVLKVTEITPGTLGVYPKADLKEVYIKFWNNDGTTRTIKYLPVEIPSSAQNNISTNNIDINEILNKINDINIKLDNILSIKNTNNTNNTVSLEKKSEASQKEVDFSVY